jgi:hypothetical protein
MVVGSKTMGEAAIAALKAVVISVLAVDVPGIVTSKGPKFFSGVVNAASVFTELYRRLQYLGPEALTWMTRRETPVIVTRSEAEAVTRNPM